MTVSTLTFIIGVDGQNELFQFGGGVRAVIEAGNNTDDKVSTRTNGLVDMVVYGGTGHDILELGSGADVIYGDDPRGVGGIDGDPANGNFDRDAILGGGNNDTIFAQGGDDVVNGENGDDFIYGGIGNDFLQGGTGNDQVHGGTGNDRIFGGAADPTIVPGLTLELFKNGLSDTFINGNQTPFIIDSKATAQPAVLTGTGNDLLYGGDGNDIIAGQDGADLIDGGAGIDTADYSTSAAAVRVNLNVTLQLGGDATGDRLVGIENVLGSSFADKLTGNNLANNLNAGAGNDILAGGAGNDILTGGAGIDTETGGAGNDFFVFNATLSSANRDIITDFNHAADTFRLENSVMTALGAPGALNPAFFHAGTGAHDANDHVIYNQATGALFYDSNGNAAGGITQLAALTNKPLLLANDFVVI